MKYEKRIGSNVPLKEWFIPLPVGAVFADVVQVYDKDRNPDNIQYIQKVVDGYLKVDFMLEPWEGFVEYKYETDPDLDVDLPEWIQDIVHTHPHEPEPDHTHVGTVTLEGGQVVIRIDSEAFKG